MLTILLLIIALGLILSAFFAGRYHIKYGGINYNSYNNTTIEVRSWTHLDIGKLISGLLLLAVAVIVWLSAYTVQIDRIVKRDVITEQIAIAEERRDSILPIIKLELSKYPEHERKVLEEYTGNGMFINIPPDVKASKTIIVIADKIEAINDKAYNLRMEHEEANGKVAYINRWIWFIALGIPKQ